MSVIAPCEDEIPSMASFCRYFAGEILELSKTQANEIALLSADLIEQSLLVRQNYLNSFSEEVPESTSQYTESHREGRGLLQMKSDGWMEEAVRSGQIFPERPLVRPRVDFEDSSKIENERNCSKLYLSSSSHSAFIFTVHYACAHPNIIGLSVM